MKNKHQNKLYLARRKQGLTRKQVASVLGYRGLSAVSRHERGATLPPLLIALELEILYRTPVAFLYPDIYKALQQAIRQKEERFRLSPRRMEGNQI